MKLRHLYLIGLWSVLVTVFVAMPSGSIMAKEVLRYSCSAQVYQAFENQRLDAFTKKTGVDIELSIFSSYKAFFRLMNGYSDIASMARRLYRRHKEFGFVETPFCKDPMAVIVCAQCPTPDLTDDQLRDIFGGTITNWKEVGGPDRPIIVVVPDEETAAYRNFGLKVMFSREMVFDIKTRRSTTVIDVTHHFPWSISFIAQGAAQYRQKDVGICRINGLLPGDEGYPYYQVFSFVTKGRPAGAAKKFIDFALSEEGKKIITNRGMVPFAKLED
jgi:phosphate transport system substrate-binding protein